VWRCRWRGDENCKIFSAFLVLPAGSETAYQGTKKMNGTAASSNRSRSLTGFDSGICPPQPKKVSKIRRLIEDF
jgi:hypothetical protein